MHMRKNTHINISYAHTCIILDIYISAHFTFHLDTKNASEYTQHNTYTHTHTHTHTMKHHDAHTIAHTHTYIDRAPDTPPIPCGCRPE